VISDDHAVRGLFQFFLGDEFPQLSVSDIEDFHCSLWRDAELLSNQGFDLLVCKLPCGRLHGHRARLRVWLGLQCLLALLGARPDDGGSHDFRLGNRPERITAEAVPELLAEVPRRPTQRH
jgi:hypothetical protein